ncbi:MAG: TIGR02253 family HAD-type hydrolase [Planctomycetes bacterium]|nr:TIGR02253 family HAD-type hydrolase [Planctomycetota bacterium]
MPSPTRLRAIFFDIDDTLFSTTVFADKARRAAVDAMLAHGLLGDRDLLMRELNEVVAEFSSNYEHHLDKLLLRLPASQLNGRNPAILVAAGVVAYHETKSRELRVYDDVYEVLRELGKSGLLLGIISAGLTVKQAEKVVRLKITEFLDPRAIFISDQIGISKPNPKLYRKACEAVGIEPREAMYVGDNPKADVEPAKKLGMVSVWMRRSGRHTLEPNAPQPDYQIRNFHELRDLLLKDFNVNFPSAGLRTPGESPAPKETEKSGGIKDLGAGA